MIRIRHTGLVVRDLEQSLSFYKALGFRLHQRRREEGPYIETVVGIPAVRLEWAKMKGAGGALLELVQYHSHPDTPPHARAPSNRLGCSHVALTVDDAMETCETIRRLGGTVVNPPSVSPDGLARVAYCHDPDGVLLEIVEDVG